MISVPTAAVAVSAVTGDVVVFHLFLYSLLFFALLLLYGRYRLILFAVTYVVANVDGFP